MSKNVLWSFFICSVCKIFEGDDLTGVFVLRFVAVIGPGSGIVPMGFAIKNGLLNYFDRKVGQSKYVRKS